jgi:hypothetical protein
VWSAGILPAMNAQRSVEVFILFDQINCARLPAASSAGRMPALHKKKSLVALSPSQQGFSSWSQSALSLRPNLNFLDLKNPWRAV